MTYSGPAWDNAVRLIGRVCRIAAPRRLRNDTADSRDHAGLRRAVADHDSPALFDWMVGIIAYQGIADRIASGWMNRNGRMSWEFVEKGLNSRNRCPKLASYWTYHGCQYRKAAQTCANPDKFSTCVIPALPARNGRLAQSAIALFLFIRDICGGDLVGLVSIWFMSDGASRYCSNDFAHAYIAERHAFYLFFILLTCGNKTMAAIKGDASGVAVQYRNFD